ncbi:MAG: hypothetical protein ABL982_06835 [Vicinamibacterales bacterium]
MTAMALLLAIEPDARQAARLTGLVSAHLGAELVLEASVEDALAALQQRRPDLVLTASSLSATDQARLMARLSSEGEPSPGVPTLAIPHLTGHLAPSRKTRGLLSRLRRPRSRLGTQNSDPAAFAAQITECLALANAVRRACEHATTGATPDATPLRESEVATAPFDLQVIVETGRADEPVVTDEWLDLEPYLDDEAGPAETTRTRVEEDAPEPDVIDLPAPDELWAQLAPGYAARMAPLEGPSMTPRAPHARTREESAGTGTSETTVAPLRLVRAPSTSDRPMQDEWGLYDPEQCGFAALLMRLEELANDDRREQERGNRSAIMRP